MTVVLTAAGVVTAACVVLAALLLVAERYLADYGTRAIDVNAGARRLEVRGGGTLLAALAGSGIFVPSACGGRGTCAYCKVKVLRGGGPVVPTEQPLLTAEESAAGVRISCQVKVREDLAVEIPGDLLSARRHRGRVERIGDLTGDIKELRVALLDPPGIEFVPGQYVQLEVPPYGASREATQRAYSISSPPADQGHIELIVRLVPGGVCTTWVFTRLREGDEVTFNGPHGHFGLSGSQAEMVWIAGGSGMAPFWSIARHMQAQNIRRKCTYFFGAVRRRDLFFLDELRQLEKEWEGFRFVPGLSGPEPGEPWDGETGLITEVVDRRVTGGTGLEAYLCGSPGMIDAAIGVLKRKGLTDDRIFFDKFA